MSIMMLIIQLIMTTLIPTIVIAAASLGRGAAPGLYASVQ